MISFQSSVWQVGLLSLLIFSTSPLSALFGQTPGTTKAPETKKAIQTVQDLIDLRTHHDETTWAKEILAQKYEQVFVKLWDSLIHRKDKFATLRAFPFETITVGTASEESDLDWKIVRREFGEGVELTRDAALKALASYEAEGYRLIESEWHHSSFEAATEESPAKSKVSILLHVEQPSSSTRMIIRGNLAIEWKAGEQPAINKIDASKLFLLIRKGNPAFRRAPVLNFKVGQDKRRPASLHPVMLHDLNKDGLPEIVIGGFNEVYWNKGNWKFRKAKLCEFPMQNVRAAIFADVTGDGIEDYLCFPIQRPPVLFRGSEGGRFADPGVSIGLTKRLAKPSCVTVGDVDGDGDLDVFVGQQKSSYTSGFIPTPYYDANDGFPFYLLLNDGKGKFRDVTQISGLGKKRMRHVFSSTFVDLDDDQDLDLLLTNDFCGCDYYENDGTGVFTDMRSKLQPTPHGFGMSHSFGDYNLDGRLDFIAIGMSSTTARRLENMGLSREGFDDYNAKRPEMGYGNRLFLNTDKGFVQAPFNDSCARTGWSWGSTTLDFDRDGDQDLYVVNGNTSGKTTKDYCTRFWCHDLYYKPGERPDGPVSELFSSLAPMFSGNLISWNGYEHNALLMNQGGKDFVNVGFLMGCAYEFDARTAISADLDNDGRIDLLVEHKDVRKSERNLYILKNDWQDEHNWLGIHLRRAKAVQGQGGAGDSPHGAKVKAILSDGTTLLQHCLSGHSVWAQHPNTVHFGLGKRTVKRLEVEWPSGATTAVDEPSLNEYLVVTPD